MRVAVIGCCHGQLELMYKTLDGCNPDIVLVCGDFQAIRDEKDLSSMAVPLKYKEMGDFHKYYSGEKRAAFLTLVIGGNHESSRYMREMPYGGWLAPNIYYFGDAGVVSFRGVRFGGLSGIFYGKDYLLPRNEKFPFVKESLYSVYHVRQSDVQRLWRMGPDYLDLMLSHDWPAGIEKYGDLRYLFHCKPFLRKDSEAGKLGSPPAFALLTHLQPALWCSAHMHVHFEATYWHSDPNDLSSEGPSPKSTQFIALDKVLPRRKFIKVLDIPAKDDTGLQLDARWLTILAETLGSAPPKLQDLSVAALQAPAVLIQDTSVPAFCHHAQLEQRLRNWAAAE